MRLPTIVRVAVLASLVWFSGEYSLQAQPETTAKVDIAELWQEPADLLQRDLEAGPGGAELAPHRDKPFQFVAHKTSGKNPGYDVRDPAGRLWSVKLGEEAQAEVTASRILWAMGFHQPPTYLLEEWTLSGVDAGVKTLGRFRTERDNSAVAGDWSWYENPFVGMQPFAGLVVAQLILSNWDLKTSNNKIYTITDASPGPRRAYVVRDLGAALGKARQNKLYKLFRIRDKQGSKNDLADFEAQGFIKRVDGNHVEFDYRGLDSSLIEIVSAADVVWACELMSRIPDTHWQAAFRAGAYSPDQTDRYVRKIKEKIAQGLALKAAATTR